MYIYIYIHYVLVVWSSNETKPPYACSSRRLSRTGGDSQPGVAEGDGPLLSFIGLALLVLFVVALVVVVVVVVIVVVVVVVLLSLLLAVLS